MDAVHHFYTEHAVKYGVEEAILLYDIIYWIAHNAANGKHFHDGRYWTYNSAAGFGNLHPYWRDEKNGRTDKIQRLLNSLIKQGAIVRGNYNVTAYDRTSWYALSDELAESILQFSEIHYAKTRNGICENGEPIPDNKPNNKTNNKPATSEAVADAPQPKKNTKFSFRDTLIAAGISADHTDTILNIRQDKRLTQSENACANLIKAITAICNQRGVTADEVAAFMVAQKWGAIRPDWQGVERIKANGRRRMVTMSVGDILNRELAI